MSEQSQLSNDWIKCKSKKHPEKQYYFNKRTGQYSWTNPVEGTVQKNKESDSTITSVLPELKLQKPKKNVAADRLKRLQNNLKANQIKNETKLRTVTSPNNKKASIKLATLTPPTSLTVVPHTAQKRKSNESVNSSKKSKTPEAKKTETFIPTQTSSPLSTKGVTIEKNCRIERSLPITKSTPKVKTLPQTISKKPEPCPSPIRLSPIKGGANVRLKELQESLEKQQTILGDDELMQPPISNTENQFSESMDWEESDAFSSCLSEITNNNDGTMSEYYESLNENSFKISSAQNSFAKSFSFSDFYFVVDTNVLLNNLTFVKDLSEKVFGASIKTIIMIPYKVIQELDGLKSRDTTASLAIRAIKLLNDKLASKDPHFQGQNAKHSKDELIPIENNDDEILNCCLQIQKTCQNVMLLSNDVNLRNKALINDIKVLNSTKAELLENNNSTIFNLMNNGSKQI
ncbi:SWT1 family protein [Megaselia abdita]